MARLDIFLMNPLVHGRSGTNPEPSQNALSINQGVNQDDSQNDALPEAGFFHGQVTRDTDLRDNHDMVTGATEQIGNCHDMAGFHEEVTYCPPSTPSGKQKKNRSISQPQLRSENKPATIKADQVLLELQQLVNNNTSANFHNNINRISNLPKSLTTTMPTFDGKSEKPELFEDLFQTSLEIHNQLPEMTESITYILS